jgi:hypothetical protein
MIVAMPVLDEGAETVTAYEVITDAGPLEVVDVTTGR